MTRTQIQLTDEQLQRLRALAASRGRSLAELIRESIDRYLADGAQDREVLKARALAVIGQFPGPPDLATNHDRYFAEDIDD